MGNFLNRWLIGFVLLRMTGKYVERFINLAIKAGLEIWDIRRFENQDFYLKVKLRDFFRLRPILKETGTRMRIVKKTGLPFFFNRVWRRKGMLIGIFLFILMLYMLSSMIWRIEVAGLEKISQAEVHKALEEVGIKKGELKWRLKPLEELQYELLKRLDQASWVGIKIDGVVVRVQVVEKVRPEEKEKLNPRHLVAKKKAVISDFFVEQGLPKVSPNQFVRQGEILISGIIGPEDDPERQRVVPAKGKVWGEVWYDSIISVPLKKEFRQFTGVTHTNHYLILGKYGIKMWGYSKSEPVDQTAKEIDRRFLYLGNLRLPIGWEKETKRVYETKIYDITKEEAIQIAKEAGRKEILLKAGEEGRIKEEKVLQQWEENDKVYIKVHYAVIEQIAAEQPILQYPQPNS